MILSQRIQRMAPSATAAMAAKAAQKRQEGQSVISFTTGEPDYASPPSALAYARKAMDAGHTHYPPTAGIAELRQAVADYYSTRFGLAYPTNEVVIGTGAKQLLYEALGCVIDPGDEVILPAPAWVSYVEQIRLFDGVPVVIQTADTGFVPTVERISAAVGPRTVALILNSPNNPTGAVYPAATLRAIGELAVARRILVLNDEVYERLIYDRPTCPHILQEVPEAREWVLNINGVSKAYAMTGWRIGFGLGPRALIKAIADFQGHLTSGTGTISQWASVGALQEAQADCERMREGFRARRALVLELLAALPGVRVPPPQGAFYVFLDVSAFLGGQGPHRPKDDVAFCEALLAEKNVALVPGTAFLQPGWVRLSYSCSEEHIREGVRRLGEFLAEIGR